MHVVQRCSWTITLLLIAGCGGSESSDARNAPSPKENPSQAAAAETKIAAKPDPAAVWAESLKQARSDLADDDLDKAEERLADLVEIAADSNPLSEQQKRELEELTNEVAAQRQAHMDQARDEKLASAQQFLDAGDYEASTRALNDVLALAPTAEQRQAAAALTAEIERRRTARRQLGAWMHMLASDIPSEVRTAQSKLAAESATALPLLLEAVQNTEKPKLVANTLELLRRLNRPEATLPAIVGVLSRVEQKQNWPDAVRELGRVNAAGAGERLLELALSSQLSEQRVAALTALSQVIDPPRRTLVALLPLIAADGPELVPALRAALHAVRVHSQDDLLARRGLEVELSPDEEQRLSELPDRLSQIIAAGDSDMSRSDAALAAKTLAVAVRLIAAGPLGGIKIASAGAQSEEFPAAAVLDGTWNTVDPKTMWRYPADSRHAIILDLGEERTVTAVRIWNFNEPNGTHRGWKEVEVFVSGATESLTPSAAGIILPAPGAADTPDYSSTIPVPLARGRYVKLQAKGLWRPDAYTGLTEVQVFGF